MLQLSCGAGLLILINLIVLVVLLVRAMPTIIRVVGYALQLGYAVSYLLYRAVLTRLAPLTMPVGLDLVRGWARVLACVLLSAAIGVAVLVLLGWAVTPLAAGLFVIHGLAVGLIWDELGPPSGPMLGV